jgi:uncharacterized SAM-binding protein YcdF (DUF218 family)
MFLYSEKVLSALATPLVFAIAVLLIAAISGRRIPRALAGFTAVLLLVCSSEDCSNLLIRTLEQPYTGTSIGSASSAQAIVVLGGYLRIKTRLPRPIEIGSAADRLLGAAELYRAGKAPLILLSGGNIPFLASSTTPPEAVAASDILEEWGIPRSAILIEDRSQDTHENAEFSHSILAEKGISRILLVTSAFHMRRASGAFRQTGLTVIPFAVDFVTQSGTPDVLFSLLPNANSLAGFGLAFREWSGFLFYRLKGWAT